VRIIRRLVRTYKAGLYWGAAGSSEASLILLPASNNGVTTTWSPFSGIFNGGIASFPVPAGTTISVQVRVWGAIYADYSAAFAAQAMGQDPWGGGKGTIQTLALGGVDDPQSLTAPTGGGTPFQRFTISFLPPIVDTPEPSSIALGLLGLGAIVLFRRRR
jgi:MYXO-CTERM domain-containing protein